MPDSTIPDDALFLGLDASTQSIKAAAVDAKLALVHEEIVNFAAEFPEFETEDGLHFHPDGLTVTQPTIMWVAALDLLLQRLQAAEFPFARVVAISVSGQQHGSVYWKTGARQALGNLDPLRSLRDQLQDAFAVAESPIWMDSSTTDQCRALEDALGGPQAVADLTGSRAYERFTGNQIAKIFQANPADYAATERISLVSSFVASLLIGDYADIDASDGSGMNLMDILRRDWAPAALDACAADLASKLGAVIPSHSAIGPIAGYHAARHGFDPACRVIAASGDNPNSLAGLRLQRTGEMAISLGTSDTIFGTLAEPKPSASEGHIFASPVDPEGYMALVCYKNGSLTREDVRDRCASGSWDEFNAALAATPKGNEGRIGFYLKEPEITPPILTTGTHRFGADDQPVDAFPAAADARAVIEGQFLSMRLHCGNIGIHPTQVLATGGASANAAIVQVVADVFGVDVYTGEQPNSSSLGAAYRALHGWVCAEKGSFVPFADVLGDGPEFTKTAEPDAAAHAVYTAMLERYRALEARVIGAG